jgi:biopolymer transport protein ExbB/TolQ
MVKILALISDSLLIPGVLVLISMFVYSLCLLGSFFSLYVRVLRSRKDCRAVMARIDAGENVDYDHYRKSEFLLELYRMDALGWNPIRCEKKIADVVQRQNWDLGRSKFLIRIGPLVGLMLTLIPMGPALVGLANGDISSMAYNLHLAFTTTVVGIFVAAVGLITYEVKNNWFQEEVTMLQHALDLKRENAEGIHAE